MANGKEDIRVAIALRDHPKTLALIDELGEGAMWRLVCLWLFAGLNRKSGVLKTTSEVEIGAGWRGKKGVFAAALVNVGWIEPDGVTIHDWPHEQPWIFNQGERSRVARENAEAGWRKRRACEPHSETDAARMPPACEPHSAAHSEPLADCYAPSPSPSPSPTPSHTDTSARADLPPLAALWNRIAEGSKLPKVTTVTGARVRHIKTALLEEPDLKVWERAFSAICADRFCRGQNDRSWRASFDYAIRPEKRGSWLDKAREQAAMDVETAPILTPEADAERRRRNTEAIYRNGAMS